MFALRWFVISNAQQKKWNDTIKEFRCNYELLPPSSTSLKEKGCATFNEAFPCISARLQYRKFILDSWNSTTANLTTKKQENAVVTFPSRINYLQQKR